VRMATAGTATAYPITTSSSAPFGLALGPDGDVWFTGTPDPVEGVALIGRLDVVVSTPTSGSPSPSSSPSPSVGAAGGVLADSGAEALPLAAAALLTLALGIVLVTRRRRTAPRG